MIWTNFVKGAVLALLLVSLSANRGCESGEVNMDKVVAELRKDMPPQYRQCLDREVTKLPKGSISWREAQELIVTLRKSELDFKRCGLGAERYYRTKIEAFANAYYQRY
jgi:hypothetical protein